MTLKDVGDVLQPIGFLKTVEIKVYPICRKEGRSPGGGDDMGFLRAVVSPEGDVTVIKMHIDPDMADQVKVLFAGTEVRVEEMPWC